MVLAAGVDTLGMTGEQWFELILPLPGQHCGMHAASLLLECLMRTRDVCRPTVRGSMKHWPQGWKVAIATIFSEGDVAGVALQGRVAS